MIAAWFLSAPAASWGQARLWEANLLDPGEALPAGFPRRPDTSLMRLPAPGLRAALESRAAWSGILRREGGGPETEIAAARGFTALWAAPFSQAAAAVLWTGSMGRNRYVDPGTLDVSLGSERQTLGFAWVQRLLPATEGARLDVGVVIPDRERQSHAWMIAWGRGPWEAELSVSQREDEEEVSAVNLDTAGSGERVAGTWRSRLVSHRLRLRAPLGGGGLSLAGGFSTSRPRRPDTEYWFCDSSRALDAFAAYARPFGPWSLEATSSFAESEAFTFGRRLPQGSEGVKRFHHARSHAVDGRLGASARLRAGRAGWTLGAGWRRLEWESAPPPDAFLSRRETLSYNRLGLSFIANLYGGLYKLSELVEARGVGDVWEARAEWDARFGGISLRAGAGCWRAGFSLDGRGSAVEQRFIALDTVPRFDWHLRGHALGVSPRLRLAWEWGRIGVEGEAAQAFPIAIRVRGLGASDAPGGGKPPARTPAFRNGFAAGVSLRAGL